MANNASPFDKPATRKAFLRHIRDGNFRRCACGCVRATTADLNRYLRMKTPEASAFKAAVERAESEVEASVVACIVRAAEASDAYAAQWLMTMKLTAVLKDTLKELKAQIKKAKAGQ